MKPNKENGVVKISQNPRRNYQLKYFQIVFFHYNANYVISVMRYSLDLWLLLTWNDLF